MPLAHSLLRRRPAWLPALALLIPLLAQVLPGAAVPAAAHQQLVLAVHPFLPYAELMDRFAPLADYLAEGLGVPVAVRVGADYQEHVQALGESRVDLAFFGPATYVLLVQEYGPVPLLARVQTGGQDFFRGHFIVRSDSPLRSLDQLGGLALAFVDPYSTMYCVPRGMLLQAGLTVPQLVGSRFLGSHQNVALGVLAGDFEVGVVKEEVFLALQDRGLRSLAITPDLPEHLFVARRDLDPRQVEAARLLLLALDDDEAGLAILRGIKSSITGLVPGVDADYDDLRRLMRVGEGAATP